MIQYPNINNDPQLNELSVGPFFWHTGNPSNAL